MAVHILTGPVLGLSKNLFDSGILAKRSVLQTQKLNLSAFLYVNVLAEKSGKIVWTPPV